MNGYDGFRHEAILHGDASKLGKCDIIFLLPDKVARFLYEYHDNRFQRQICPPFLTTGVSLTCMLR